MPKTEPVLTINIERKPMSAAQAAAWSRFWNEIIEDSKKEVARTDNSSRAREVSSDSTSRN